MNAVPLNFSHRLILLNFFVVFFTFSPLILYFFVAFFSFFVLYIFGDTFFVSL